MPKPKASQTWERDPHDWYVESVAATEGLLRVEAFPGWTHDPCCGGGNILRALTAAGCAVSGTDLVKRTDLASFWGEVDFLKSDIPLAGADNCIMNPPFFKGVGARDFIMKALDETPGKVAAFVAARFLFGVKRARTLYANTPPNRIWAITPRPSCPPGVFIAAGGEPGGDTQDYVWLVWDGRLDRLPAGASPAFGWIR